MSLVCQGKIPSKDAKVLGGTPSTYGNKGGSATISLRQCRSEDLSGIPFLLRITGLEKLFPLVACRSVAFE